MATSVVFVSRRPSRSAPAWRESPRQQGEEVSLIDCLAADVDGRRGGEKERHSVTWMRFGRMVRCVCVWVVGGVGHFLTFGSVVACRGVVCSSGSERPHALRRKVHQLAAVSEVGHILLVQLCVSVNV